MLNYNKLARNIYFLDDDVIIQKIEEKTIEFHKITGDKLKKILLDYVNMKNVYFSAKYGNHNDFFVAESVRNSKKMFISDFINDDTNILLLAVQYYIAINFVPPNNIAMMDDIIMYLSWILDNSTAKSKIYLNKTFAEVFYDLHNDSNGGVINYKKHYEKYKMKLLTGYNIII